MDNRIVNTKKYSEKENNKAGPGFIKFLISNLRLINTKYY
jgi:hypothetical protein